MPMRFLRTALGSTESRDDHPPSRLYPGMLDNTVGGGIATGELSLESIIREATGEDALPEEMVRKGAKTVGVVTYFDMRDKHAGGEIGMVQPECIFVYDLSRVGCCSQARQPWS